MKKPFYETTWSKVKVGDTALMAWPTGRRIDVVEIEITKLAHDPTPNNEEPLGIFFRVDGLIYGQTFNPDDKAYVQDRL